MRQPLNQTVPAGLAGVVLAAGGLPGACLTGLSRKRDHLGGRQEEGPLRPTQGCFRQTQEFLKLKEGPFRSTKGPLRPTK